MPALLGRVMQTDGTVAYGPWALGITMPHWVLAGADEVIR
jgi:hypothetical protein